MRDDARSERGSHGEGMSDLCAISVAAVIDPSQSEFEAVTAATALQGQVREVEDVAGGSGGRVEEVGGGYGVGGVEGAQVGAEEEGAGDGHAEHFVRVDGDGVGQVGSGQLVRVRGGEDGGSAPGGVDV